MEDRIGKELKLPLIPLRGAIALPSMMLHFDVGRRKSLRAIEKARDEDSLIVLTAQHSPLEENPTEDDYYNWGTIAKIIQVISLPGGGLRVLAEGISRAYIEESNHKGEYIEVVVKEYSRSKIEDEEEYKKIEAAKRLILKDLENYIRRDGSKIEESLIAAQEIEDGGYLADLITSYINLKIDEKQEILEELNPLKRLEKLHGFLTFELEIMKIEEEISSKVKENMEQVQREFFLREQVKVIQKELGEDDLDSEIDDYIKNIKKLNLEKESNKKVLKEVDRLRRTPTNSPEGAIIRNYLDWISLLPWNKSNEKKIEIKEAERILNEEHYGLDDVKERILEYIAVRELSKDLKGPILCLVGPPGVGKTSIARSIAKAMKRDFVRMSLGGLRDEAEIRGHRRTYVGAMPGSIISNIRKASSNNPVFLLDEIDKIGTDFRGDPASALLEVLDPEQNKSFMDHFLEIPFDLSKVVFITTANSIDTIPKPLLDRMELINIESYTSNEKLEIAKRYLISKQIKENGLKKDNVRISDNALRIIIDSYTREAGVRNLEREISKIVRKSSKIILEEKKEIIRVNKGNLEKFLGKKKLKKQELAKKDKVGIVNGLAWTPVGGEILTVEVLIMDGDGKVHLTGKLGDTMKESALAAISYIRANLASKLEEVDFYKKKDIHLHVPEGAIPKDGPSAGITIATAIASALFKTPVYRDLAMTGEITLSGRVLPIGGLKEKVLAGSKIGIKRIILPAGNKADLDELSPDVKGNIDFVLVDDISQVLEESLVK